MSVVQLIRSLPVREQGVLDLVAPDGEASKPTGGKRRATVGCDKCESG